MNKCIICSIVNKTLSSFIVFENDDFISFLDNHPVFLGHCLLAPKKHLITLYDMPSDNLEPYFNLLQIIGKAIEKTMSAKGTFIAINNIVSQSIPHLHTHIVPRQFKDGLRGFFWPRLKYNNEQQMEEIKENIKKNINL